MIGRPSSFYIKNQPKNRTNKPTTDLPTEPTMSFDFETHRALLKSDGYILIDYTAKIKKLTDLIVIMDKVKTTNNGEYVYKKMIIIVRLDKICEKIKPLRNILIRDNKNPDGIQAFYKKYVMTFDKDMCPNALNWKSFLQAKEKNECSICCETKKFCEMMACTDCIYPYCKECFMKRYRESDDSRCFGCRREMMVLKEVNKKV